MFKIFFIFFIFFISSSMADELQPVIQAQIQNNDLARASQEEISNSAQQTRQMADEHTITLRQLEDTRAYNNQLRKIIESQKKEKVSILQQIREVKHTDKQIVPLMLEMLTSLENFIQMDIPFLKEERQERLSELKEMMDRADISVSEKYRKILEAYQIEHEYGRTIGVYQSFQNIDGKDLSVHFLRVGRLALIYQTLDEKKRAYWSQERRKWIPISSKFKKSISMAIRVAKGLSPPNFVVAWLSAPTKINPLFTQMNDHVPKELNEEDAKTNNKQEDSSEKPSEIIKKEDRLQEQFE